MGKEIHAGRFHPFGSPKQKILTINGVIFRTPKVEIRPESRVGNSFRINGESFRGSIFLIQKSNRILLVNVIDLEDYLKGMLATEINSYWSVESLKAQAVASRTYAMYMKDHPRSADYDLERTISDQVYGGLNSENTKTSKAIKETEGQFLGEAGKPIKAFFHARCGGSTETPETVWNHKGKQNHESVECPFCQKNPQPWTTTIDAQTLAEKLGVIPFRKFSVEVTQRTEGNRISEFLVVAGKKKIRMNANDFRARLGYKRLKSTLFEWKQKAQQIIFSGVGSGHGVGMCQWGAKHLAETGNNYQQILTHYYPRSTLYGVDQKTQPSPRVAQSALYTPINAQ